MTDQPRADFESHFQLTTRQKWQHPDGSYKFPEIQSKWEGYLAGVAKAAPNPLEGWDKAVAYVNQRWPAQEPAAWICIYDDGEVDYTPLRELAEAAPTAIPLYRSAAAPGDDDKCESCNGYGVVGGGLDQMPCTDCMATGKARD